MVDNKQIYTYFSGIYYYEKKLSEMYDESPSSKSKDYQGFLIKLSDYDNFKKSIKYEQLLKENDNSINISKEKFADLVEKYKLSISKVKKIEQINAQTPEKLIQLIKNGVKLKIISKKLCELICFNDEDISITYHYYIKSDFLENLNISFSHHDNILDEFSYANGNKKLINLANSIIDYYNLENEFKNNIVFQSDIDHKLDILNNIEIKRDNNVFFESFYNLDENKIINDVNQNKISKNNTIKRKNTLDNFNKSKKNNDIQQNNLKIINKIDYDSLFINEGFLVTEKWINQWKKYTNYKKIKDEYSCNIKYKKEKIIEELYYYQKNNNEIKELEPIELIYFESKDEYKNFIEHNNIVIINNDFYSCFNKNIKNKIRYSFNNEIITIYFKDLSMDLISKNNIILRKSYANLIILQLINDFQEEKKSNYNFNFKNKFNKIGLVEKNWIQELKNKYLYNIYKAEIKKISNKNFSISNISNIYLDKIKELEEKNELDIKSKEKLKIINKELNNKQIKYITDFEIVDIDTIKLLKILYNNFSDYYYEGEYYISYDALYSNVIISFQYNDNNYYYQIGKIDKNQTFVVNYIIYFDKNVSSSSLSNELLYNKEKEIEFFDKIYYNGCNNELLINYYIKCYYYKLNFNDDFEQLKNIFFRINKFENEIKKYIMDEGKIYSFDNCYLINKNSLDEFKKIFLFKEMNTNNKNNYIDDKKKYFDIFLDKKKYEKIFDVNNLLTEKNFKTIKNITFLYPYNFDIITDKILYLLINFTKSLSFTIFDRIFQKVHFIINQRKIIIKIKTNNILIIGIGKNYEYIPEMILNFNILIIRDNFFNLFYGYKFNEIISDKIISFIYNEKNEIIANKYLINYEGIKNNNNEQDIKNYLEIILEFYKINENIISKKNRIISITPTINKEEFYLVNKKWLDEFKYFFSYDEILQTLNNNKKLIMNSNDINLIYNKLGEELRKNLNNLNENIIAKKFNNKNLYNLINKNIIIDNKNNCLLYFNSCAIINKQIIDLIKINNQINKANCILGDGKILLISETVIIIGNFNNNLFNTEYIINLDNNENITFIEKMVKIRGIDYINKLLVENKILNIHNNAIKSLAKLDNLNNIEYDDSIIKKFDDRFQFLLILCIYQLKFKIQRKEKNYFILNSEFLSELDYYSLFNTLINIIQMNQDIQSDIQSSNIKEKEILYKLSKYLNNEIIDDIQKNIKNVNVQNFEKNLYSKKINIVLPDQKCVYAYNNFIIVDKNIISLFKKIFIINITNINEINISYESLNQNRILINDRNNKNILLEYIMNNENNNFQLECIFDYKNEFDINSEFKKLIDNYENYFFKNLIFNAKYQNDYISPIFSETDIIGNCYKYNNKTIINNYSIYHLNINLSNIIQIYIYDSIFRNIIRKKYYNFLNDYYLVDINFLKKYKEYYDYEQIKKELDNTKDNSTIINNIFNEIFLKNNTKICTTKYFYYFVKAINPDINIKFNSTKKEIIKENKIFPDIVEMEYLDFISKEKQIVKIATNFQLINKNILALFIDNENIFNQNRKTYDIIKINDYILINFPKGKNNNSQYITYIGKINEEATFTLSFILIYYSNEERYKHIEFLKKYLDNYLKGISLVNYKNIQIFNEKYEFIGILIKNNNKINYNNFDIEIEILKKENNKYKEFESKYNEEKIKNNNLNNKIKELEDNNILKESLLNEEKSKNNKLKNENDNKLKELEKIKLSNDDLQKKIKEQNNDLDNEKRNCDNLKIKNNEYEKELNNLKLNNNDFQNKLKKLNDELENEKNNNNNLKSEIIVLKQNFNNEIKKLNETINVKETELNERNLKLNELNQKLELLENDDDKNNKIIKLYEELKSKENEIKEIQSRYPVVLSKDEKLICVILLSMDQKIHYPIICKANDKFLKIEELLYKEYPELSETENIFLVNGEKINRAKNLEFYNIKHGDVIIINNQINDKENDE